MFYINNLVANCGLVRLLFESLGELYTDIYLFANSSFLFPIPTMEFSLFQQFNPSTVRHWSKRRDLEGNSALRRSPKRDDDISKC